LENDDNDDRLQIDLNSWVKIEQIFSIFTSYFFPQPTLTHIFITQAIFPYTNIHMLPALYFPFSLLFLLQSRIIEKLLPSTDFSFSWRNKKKKLQIIKGEISRASHTLIGCEREIHSPHQERNFKMLMSLEQRSVNNLTSEGEIWFCSTI
jgi:hypothetical protein